MQIPFLYKWLLANSRQTQKKNTYSLYTKRYRFSCGPFSALLRCARWMTSYRMECALMNKNEISKILSHTPVYIWVFGRIFFLFILCRKTSELSLPYFLCSFCLFPLSLKCAIQSHWYFLTNVPKFGLYHYFQMWLADPNRI